MRYEDEGTLFLKLTFNLEGFVGIIRHRLGLSGGIRSSSVE